MSTLLLLGATGLVGGHVLRQSLSDVSIEQVVAPTRRPLAPHDKLANPIVAVGALPTDESWWRVDAVISAFGTTRAQAGTEAAFLAIDRDFPLEFMRVAQRHGAKVAALCSAQGADARSRFLYFRSKGQLEDAVIDLAFPSLTIARPGMIGGRPEPAPGERRTLRLLSALAPLLPRRLRINPADRIARALLDAVRSGAHGLHVVSAGQLAG